MATKLSLESIDFQNGKLFEQLTNAVDALKADGTFTTEAIKKAEIPEIIQLYTDALVKFRVIADQKINAYMEVPALDRNHPFITEIEKAYVSSKAGTMLIQTLGGAVKGGVNLRNGRVYGVFTKIEGTITVTQGLIQSKDFSSAEVAAIILHELGHIVTYFEYLGSVVTNSHIIAAAAKAATDIDDFNERVKVLKVAEDVLGLEKIDIDALARTNQKMRGKATETVFISALAIKTRSNTGASIYELRAVEQLADQFAVRHGAGKDLAVGLDRLYRYVWDSSTMWTATHVFLEVAKMIGASFVLVGCPPAGAAVFVLLFMTNPLNRRYDEPEARLRLIKQMLVEELKETKQDPDHLRKIDEDIRVVSILEESLNDNRGIVELFWSNIMPEGRAGWQQERAQKEIEALLNNDLFTMANRFKIGE